MTYSTPDLYTINQNIAANTVILTPTYSALSDISTVPRTQTLVATLKSDTTKTATTSF
jgi:hypothetical protein